MAALEFPFLPEELAALLEFLQRCCVPLFGSGKYDGDLFGTGTFFSVNDRYYLVTAAHVLQKIAPDKIRIPHGQSNVKAYGLGAVQVARTIETGDLDFDVAIIRLTDEKTISSLKTEWTFLGPQNIGNAQSTADWYFVAGYPHALVRQRAKRVHARLQAILMQRLRNVPAEATAPLDPYVDIFFEYGRRAFVADTPQEVETPDLAGVSGASVWAVARPANYKGIWTAGSQAKIVAIQSAAFHSKYIRAKNWAAVEAALKHIDPESSRFFEAEKT